jgi:hypothetical protein
VQPLDFPKLAPATPYHQRSGGQKGDPHLQTREDQAWGCGSDQKVVDGARASMQTSADWSDRSRAQQ